MTSERYRIFLIPDASGPPLVPARRRARSHPKQPHSQGQDVSLAVGALLNAFSRVCRRGPGPAAWAPVMDDPLAFLLDAMSDAVVLRGPC